MSDHHSPDAHQAPTHNETPHGAAHAYPVDAVEAAAHKVPFVLPAVGAVMIFLLAMIAVNMA